MLRPQWFQAELRGDQLQGDNEIVGDEGSAHGPKLGGPAPGSHLIWAEAKGVRVHCRSPLTLEG
ncbi:hypothetical protein GCM10010349_64680 [Streptomyces flavofungini]|nr:hypothetical protein GCM10010349_64680 [Streptomyces flavofungini]